MRAFVILVLLPVTGWCQSNFFPVDNKNIWIYASQSWGIPPAPDTLTITLENLTYNGKPAFRLHSECVPFNCSAWPLWGNYLIQDDKGNIRNGETEVFIFDFSAPIERSVGYIGTSKESIASNLGIKEDFIEIEFGKPTPSERESSEVIGAYIFAENVGLIRIYINSTLFSGYRTTDLIWARVNGRNYGQHPGERFTGYETAIEARSWGETKIDVKK